MRRQIGAAALAVVTLLTLSSVAAGAVHASVPGTVAADDVFIPVGDGEQAPAEAPASTPPTASNSDREAALARGNRQAADLMGFMPSLYQGKWFKPGVENVRRCIVMRESRANNRATSGKYHGAYQMSAALARGATWMMQKEVRKEMGQEGVAIVKALRKTTPNNWNRYWQDRAFWTIWRNGSGASHWAGGAHRC